MFSYRKDKINISIDTYRYIYEKELVKVKYYKTIYHSDAYDITQNTFLKFFSHIE